jgi:hypothetical protein
MPMMPESSAGNAPQPRSVAADGAQRRNRPEPHGRRIIIVRRPGAGALARWVIANFGAGIVGWAVSALLILATGGLGAVVAGTIAGLVIGYVQGRLLRRYMRTATPPELWAEWMFASAAGATFAWLALLLPRALGYIVRPPSGVMNSFDVWDRPLVWIATFAIAGAVVGLFQRGLLPYGWHAAGAWILANALGWCVGGFLAASVGESVYRSIAREAFAAGANPERFGMTEVVEFAVAGTVGAVTASLVTGAALLRLLRQRNEDAAD